MNPCNALRFLLLTLFALFVLIAPAPAEANGSDLTLVIADLGIRQKGPWRTGGDDALGWVYPELPRTARIAVVMPDRQRFQAMSTDELQQSVFELLKKRVGAARAAGHTRIEIQLVEDIGPLGYLDQGDLGNQQDVDRFGAAAYRAIVDLNRSLLSNGVRVRNEAVVASNGTKVWAANASNWLLDGKSIWSGVDLFDGRAEVQPAVRAIQLAGPPNVRVFNTRGDIWALDLVGTAKWVASAGLTEDFFFSVAKAQTSRAMKDALPAMRVFYLRRDNGFTTEHIAGTKADNSFAVTEYLGASDGYAALPGRFTGSDLRASNTLPRPPRRESLSLPSATDGRIPLRREVATDWADLLLTYANELTEKHKGVNPALPYVVLAAQGQKLHLAIRKELDASAGAPFVTVSNEVVESSLRLMVGALDVRERLKLATGQGLKHATLIDGIIDIGAFALSAASEGTVDAEAAKKLQSGTLKLGKDYLLAHAKRQVERLHDVAPLEARIKAARLEIDGLTRAARDAGLRVRDGSFKGAGRLADLQRALKADTYELVKRRAEVDAVHRNVSAALLMLDAVPEFSAAIMAQQAAGGRWTLDVIDRYSDAVIVLTSSFLISQRVQKVPVLGYFAGAARDALVLGSRYLRDTAKRSPTNAVIRLFTSAERAQIFDQYATYFERQRALGLEPLTFSAYYKGVDLAGAGIRDSERTELDARVLAENEKIAQLKEAAAAIAEERQRMAKKGPLVKDPDLRLPVPRNESMPPPAPYESKYPPPPRWPPPGAGGGPNPPATPAPAGGSNDPPGKSGAKVGGVRLATAASTADPMLLQVQALSFDAATGRLVLVGREGAASMSLNERDLAWALHLQYRTRPEEIQFSLDPADPANVNGPWLRAVYWPEDLKGTGIGETLFEGDFSMKKLGLGVEVNANGTLETRAPVVPGFLSVPDLMRSDPSQAGRAGQWARYWIVSERMELQQAEGVLRFADARMAVRSRKQVPDPTSRTGLRDVATDPRSLEAQWAAMLTARYDEVGAALPEFARIVELAKAVAIAKWLKQQGVHVDPQWIQSRVQQPSGAGTERVPALSASFREESSREIRTSRGTGVETTVRTIRVFGGVDLTVKPVMRPADASTVDLGKAISLAWKKHPDKVAFPVEWRGERWVARVVDLGSPLLARRQ